MNNKNDKIHVGNIDTKIPPLEQAYSGFTEEDKRQALIKFSQQISMHFPSILDHERDKSAAQIHIKNIEEQVQLEKQDSQVIHNALNALIKIGESKQDDMMACALLDYIDEIIELISPRQ